MRVCPRLVLITRIRICRVAAATVARVAFVGGTVGGSVRGVAVQSAREAQASDGVAVWIWGYTLSVCLSFRCVLQRSLTVAADVWDLRCTKKGRQRSERKKL